MTVWAVDACCAMRFHFGTFFTNTSRGQTNIGYLTFSSRQSGSAVPGNKLADAGNLAQGHTHSGKEKDHNLNSNLVSSATVSHLPPDRETLCPAVWGITETTDHPSSPLFPVTPFFPFQDWIHPPPKLLYLMNTPLKKTQGRQRQARFVWARVCGVQGVKEKRLERNQRC